MCQRPKARKILITTSPWRVIKRRYLGAIVRHPISSCLSIWRGLKFQFLYETANEIRLMNPLWYSMEKSNELCANVQICNELDISFEIVENFTLFRMMKYFAGQKKNETVGAVPHPTPPDAIAIARLCPAVDGEIFSFSFLQFLIACNKLLLASRVGWLIKWLHPEIKF